MTKTFLKGAFIAAAVGGFFAAGSNAQAETPAKDGDKVMCEGINSCKGTGACAGPGHGCAGQNACKGQGHTKVTKKECADKGGKIAEAKKPEKGEQKKN
jgi:hypothetical protein